MRLLFIGFGIWALHRGALQSSHAWIAVALISLGFGVAIHIRKNFRMDWGWVYIIRDLTRRFK
jgi:hypothetical protein